MSNALKPCPHCGNGSLLVIARRASIYPLPDVKVFEGRVLCEECGGAMLLSHMTRNDTPDDTGVSELREILRERWNARAESTCRWVPFDEGHSIAGPGWRCSECGLELGPENAFVVEQCYCCPGCQSRVVIE